jgi:hypothetical protein
MSVVQVHVTLDLDMSLFTTQRAALSNVVAQEEDPADMALLDGLLNLTDFISDACVGQGLVSDEQVQQWWKDYFGFDASESTVEPASSANVDVAGAERD